MDKEIINVLSGEKPIQVTVDDIDFVYLALALFVGIFMSIVFADIVTRIM